MVHASKYKLANAVLFQGGWFSCILLPIQLSIVTTTAILLIHFKMSKNFNKELLLVTSIGIVGYCMDSIYSFTGNIDLCPGSGSQIYLVCVWLLFATTLNSSMKFFTNHSVKAALLGLLAPVSYYAAQQFGKVKYSEPLLQSILFHALLWSFFMLLVHKLYFDQNSQGYNER